RLARPWAVRGQRLEGPLPCDGRSRAVDTRPHGRDDAARARAESVGNRDSRLDAGRYRCRRSRPCLAVVVPFDWRRPWGLGRGSCCALPCRLSHRAAGLLQLLLSGCVLCAAVVGTLQQHDQSEHRGDRTAGDYLNTVMRAVLVRFSVVAGIKLVTGENELLTC